MRCHTLSMLRLHRLISIRKFRYLGWVKSKMIISNPHYYYTVLCIFRLAQKLIQVMTWNSWIRSRINQMIFHWLIRRRSVMSRDAIQRFSGNRISVNSLYVMRLRWSLIDRRALDVTHERYIFALYSHVPFILFRVFLMPILLHYCQNERN